MLPRSRIHILIRSQFLLTQNNIIMNKYISIIVKLVLIAYLALVFTRIGLYKQAVFKQYQNGGTGGESQLSSVLEQNQVLKRLHDLTDIPIIGSYFMQPMAEELIRLQRFQEGLEIASHSLDSIFKARDFKLWLSKAKAQLSLQKFQDCELSLSTASLYARTWLDELRVTSLSDKLDNKKAYKKMNSFLEISPIANDQREEEKDYVRLLLEKQNQTL